MSVTVNLPLSREQQGSHPSTPSYFKHETGVTVLPPRAHNL